MEATKVKSAVVVLSETIGEYELTANVNVNDGSDMMMQQNGSISNGEVKNGTGRVGTFSSANAVNLSTNYNVEDANERLEIHQAVQQFVQSAREYIKTSTISIENNEA